MPTQIIDGFRLNTATPIDSRLVTTGTASRNLMLYKYEGLRVYDIIQKTPFVYIDGVWKEESGTTVSSSSSSGTGMKLGGGENFIPKITSYGTTSSIIREYTATGDERRIGINVPSTTTIAKTLHVVGNSQFDGQINASQFVGSISGNDVQYPVNVDKLSTPGDTKTYVLKSINNINKWVAETTGSKITVTNTIVEENLLLVLSRDPSTDSSGNELYVNKNTASDLLAVNTKTRQLIVSSNNAIDKPQYSFVGILNTGMYGSSTEIGLSMAGSKRVYVTSTMVGINIGTSTIAKFESALTTINTATEISGTNTFKVGGATTLNDTLTVATDKSTTLGGTLIVASGKATTLGGTLTVTGVSTLNDTLTVATGKATTLGGTLTVTGVSTLNDTLTVATGKATTLGGTLTVGDTITGKTVVLTPAADTVGISVTSSMLTSPPNNIINNNGTGLYIQSTGEGLRLDNSGSSLYNIITFFGNKNGKTIGGLSPTNRTGWMGYDATSTPNMMFVNEQNSETRFYVGPETAKIGGKRMTIDNKGVSIGKSNAGDTKNRISRLFYGKIRIAPNGTTSFINANNGEILAGDGFTVTYESYTTNTSATVKITATHPFHNNEIPVIVTSIDSNSMSDPMRYMVGTQWYHTDWTGSSSNYQSFYLSVSSIYVDTNGQGNWGKYGVTKEDCVGVSFMVILPGGDFGMSNGTTEPWKQLT